VNWEAIGAIAEAVGAAGVIFSLLYFAIRMRPSSRLTKRAAAQELRSVRTQINLLIARDPVLNELF
jgi:hypothetical protein